MGILYIYVGYVNIECGMKNTQQFIFQETGRYRGRERFSLLKLFIVVIDLKFFFIQIFYFFFASVG